MTKPWHDCKRLQFPPDRPTLDDVAVAAGVSPATVSRALRRPDLVNERTRARVLEAVTALGYRAHVGARSLAGGRTDAVAVVVPDVANPFFAALVQAIQASAAELGAVTLLGDARHDPDLEVDLVRRLADRADAVVACAAVAPTSALRDAAGPRPLVLVNRRSRSVRSVAVDQAAVLRLAVAHLVALGHRRLAWAPGPSGLWSTRARRRASGAVATELACEVVEVGPATATDRDGPAAVHAAVARGATALVAFNDVQALAAMSAAARSGIAVPEDLSVIGADDIATASLVTPALTTVAAPLGQLGRAAVELAADPSGPGELTLAPALVVRASCGPPPPVLGK